MGKGHYQLVFITAVDDLLVPDGSSRLSNIGDPTLQGSLNIIREGEKGIRSQGNSFYPGEELFLSLGSQDLGLPAEVFLPNPILTNIFLVLIDVAVDDVILGISTEFGQEGKG